MDRPVAVHVGPVADDAVLAAVRDGGGDPADLADADAVVWLDPSPDAFPDRLPDRVRWVQLPAAGIGPWLQHGVVDDARAWTSAAGAYADTVAEHALALLLAGVRRIPASVRARTWRDPHPAVLRGSTVAVVGAGGIGAALISLLAPVGVDVVAVTRSGRTVEGAARSVAASDLAEVWPAVDHVVLAAPATDETHHLLDAGALAALPDAAVVVNVGRGELVDTDALVAALDGGEVAGAALDVTDPEPLPDGHPLWDRDDVVVTPHVANPEAALRAALAARVADNLARFRRGEPLLGLVDVGRGY